MDASYRRYRRYRTNCQQYRVDQIAAPVTVMMILSFVTKYWWVLVALLLAMCVFSLSKGYDRKKRRREEYNNYVPDMSIELIEGANFQKEEGKTMNTTEIGYVNRNNQRNNGKTDIPGTDFGQWFYDMECMDCGHKYHANGSDIWLRKCPKCQKTKSSEKKASTGKSTEVGYINKNNQRNNGKTDIPGTGNGQWFYDMECLDCGHKYHANGHDVWLRKCPKCQGGRT